MFTKTAIIVVLLTFYSNSLPVSDFSNTTKDNDLVLLHVLFRHGNRTAEESELYPNDPYLKERYFPFGLGQLTNAGQQREYLIGKELHDRYSNFLGKYYYPEIVDAWTTNYNRTKMSLQLALAGLFPPKDVKIWNYVLKWQPVPYNYLPKHDDPVLLGVLCPTYLDLYDEYRSSSKHQAELAKYQDVLSYLSEKTGKNMTDFVDVYDLFFGLATEEEWGFSLPEWTKSVWPEKITELAIKEYYTAMATTELRKIGAGYFVKKIIDDTRRKLNGLTPKRKIYVYSAHESNLAEFLIALNVFEPHVPTYGSYIIVEVRKIDDVPGIRVLYQNYSSENPKVLKMPACEEFCPLDKFEKLLDEYIPKTDMCTKNKKQY